MPLNSRRDLWQSKTIYMSFVPYSSVGYVSIAFTGGVAYREEVKKRMIADFIISYIHYIEVLSKEGLMGFSHYLELVVAARFI